MLKRGLIMIALTWTVWGCGASTQYGTQTKVDNPDAPAIIDYYAAEVIRPGAAWRVYLHARDENGDMRDIVARLLQTGAASATYTIRIEEKHSREVAGYLALRTPRVPRSSRSIWNGSAPNRGGYRPLHTSHRFRRWSYPRAAYPIGR